jgi:hypothetical protein
MEYYDLLIKLKERHGSVYKVSLLSGVNYTTLQALYSKRSKDPRLSTYNALMALYNKNGDNKNEY